jgi:glutamine amidotransferase
MGNLGSVRRALIEVGADPVVAEKPEELQGADRIILPGVGNFADGMRNLTEEGWVPELQEYAKRSRPLLGICLGMQLLANYGTEGGGCAGLGLISGEVRKIDTLGCNLRIPHSGWNNIELIGKSEELFRGIPCGTDFYFVHSYAFIPTKLENMLATVDYGVPLTAAISSGCVFGTQFHPEKSSKSGFRVLQNFIGTQTC